MILTVEKRSYIINCNKLGRFESMDNEEKKVYGEKLGYLSILRSVAKLFGFWHWNKEDVNKEKTQLTKELQKHNKNLLSKIFNGKEHKRIQRILENRLYNANSVSQILEANPNKNKDFSLNEIVKQAIEKASKYFSEEESMSIQSFASSRLDNISCTDHITIPAELDCIFFSEGMDNQSVENKTVTPEKNLKQSAEKEREM